MSDEASNEAEVHWRLTRGGLCASFRVLLPPPWPQAVYAKVVNLFHGEAVDERMIKRVVRQAEVYCEQNRRWSMICAGRL